MSEFIRRFLLRLGREGGLMTEFIISSEQLERLIEGIEHHTGRRITQVICDGTELPVVVRCRDCQHYTEDDMEYYHYCGEWCEQVEPDGFCAWGERKMKK